MRKITLMAAVGMILIPATAWSQSADSSSRAGIAIPSSANVHWRGGTRLEFGDSGFTAKINTQIQPRYEFTDNDSSANTSSFRMRRARIQIEGTALDKEFTYRIQQDFVGASSGGTRTPDLRDAYLQWNASDAFSVRMGQFKTAAGRQENNSSSKLQFPDRTVASDYFTISRAQGARIAGKLGDSASFVAGIFNGESDGEGRNRPGVDTNHTVDVGLRATLIGKMDAHEEGDMSQTQDLALAGGVSYTFSDSKNDLGAGLEGVDTHRVTADLNLKYNGFSTHGEFFFMDSDPDITGDGFSALGGYVQAGYFFVPKKWEIAARYGIIDCDDGKASGVCAGNDLVHEVGASLNHFFWGHNLKAQLAFFHQNEDPVASAASSIKTNKVIFQVAAYF